MVMETDIAAPIVSTTRSSLGAATVTRRAKRAITGRLTTASPAIPGRGCLIRMGMVTVTAVLLINTTRR